jgi:hypothetical protein
MILIWRDPTRGEALSLVVIGIKSGSVAWVDILNIGYPVRKLRNGEPSNPINRVAAEEQ